MYLIFLHLEWLMVTMMNCFCGMVDRRKRFSLISNRDYCKKSLPSWISNTPWADLNLCRNWVQALLNEVVQWWWPLHHDNGCIVFLMDANEVCKYHKITFFNQENLESSAIGKEESDDFASDLCKMNVLNIYHLKRNCKRRWNIEK